MASFSETQFKNPRSRVYIPLLPVTYNSIDATNHRFQSKFKGIITFLVKLIIALCLLYSLNMAILFSLGPKTPSIQLNSLSVSSATVSNTKMAGNWVANFSLFNPNMAVGFSLDKIDGLILYKDDSALSVASMDGFRLGLREEKTVNVRFATTGWDGNQPMVEFPVLREIIEARRSRTVRFGVRMSVWATYKASWVGLSKHVVLNLHCLDLNVGVVGGTGHGKSEADGPKDCSVVMTHTV